MINVITGFGSSFKGLAAYLYHDVDRADTSERVAWTHTHNLATKNPETAWKVMAATAMKSDELKKNAGVAATGRKSKDHVMHYVLSWHTEEHGQVSKEEMIDAALASMTYLGTYQGEKLGKNKTALRTQHAYDHQAVVVCHDEGPGKAPHVHVMVNRVHPEHGVMLSDSKDYEKLSAWALDYRKAQGKTQYCPERAKNAAKRAQGVLTSNPRKARNVYEVEQAKKGMPDNSREKTLIEQQQRQAKLLKAKLEAMKIRHGDEIATIENRHLAAVKDTRVKAVAAVRAARSKVRGEYAPKIDALTQKQRAELDAFHQAKETIGGHARNAWAAIKTKEWMHDLRASKLQAVTDAFKLAFSSGFQQRQLEAFHGREQGQLRGDRTRAERSAGRTIRDEQRGKLDALRASYSIVRNDIVFTHDMDKAKMKAEWNQLQRDRLMTIAGGGRTPRPGIEQQNAERQSLSPSQQQAAKSRTYDIPAEKLRAMTKDRDESHEHGRDRENEADKGIGR